MTRNSRLLSTITLASALVLTGCAADSGTNGVGGATGDSVTASESPKGAAEPSVADEPEPVEPEPTEENLITSVKIKSCKLGDYGVEITGTISNPSKEVSDMSATIEITNSKGDRIDEAGVLESAIKPGQKVNFDASGLESKESLPTKKFTCTVLTVDRYPSS